MTPFERQLVELRPLMIRIALTRYNLSPDDAEDVVQDAQLSMWRFRDKFDGQSIQGWMRTILYNTLINRYRQRTAQKRRDNDYVRLEIPDAFGRPRCPYPASNPDVHETLPDDITDALNSLPHPMRTAVILVDLEGIPHDEAAELMGCKSNTSKTRCFRGREILRKKLSHYREGIQ